MIFGLVGGAMAADAPAAPPAPPVAKNAGDPVTAWQAKTVDTNETVSSAAIKGDYAIVFVNSSCSACRKEMNSLRTAEFKGLEVMIASVDFNPQKTVKKYRKMQLEFPILDASDLKLLGMFGFGYTPATVIVSDGKLAFSHAGYAAHDEQIIGDAFKKYR